MPKTILAVGAHADDAEWGSGGVLMKAAGEGHRVVVVTTIGKFSGYPPCEGRAEEVKRGMEEIARKMGFVKKVFLDCPYHFSLAHNTEVMRQISEIIQEYRPEIAFIHQPYDYWADHANAYQVAKDASLFSHAFFGPKAHHPERLLTFPIATLQTERFEPDVYVDITDVAKEFAQLMLEMEALYQNRKVEEIIEMKLEVVGDAHGKPTRKQTLMLGNWGADMFPTFTLWGARIGVRFAQGFRQIWGRKGISLW